MSGFEGETGDGFARRRTAGVGARPAGRASDAGWMVIGGDFEYERRMNNWRLWRLSERRSHGGSPYPVYNLTPRPPRGENIIPILAGEADETERAVAALPAPMRKAVEVWFLCSGTVNQKRKMLRCRRERMFELLDAARKAVIEKLAR